MSGASQYRLICRGGCPLCFEDGSGSLCDKHFAEVQRKVLELEGATQ